MQSEQSVQNVVLVGCGEVGRAFGARIEEHSTVPLVRVDPACPDLRDGRILRTLPDELPDECLVLAAVPSSAAIEVARHVARCSSRLLHVDLSSSSRSLMRACADAFSPASERFVDAAIMGSVDLAGADTPIVLSGAAAGDAADILRSFGFHASALPGSGAGDASGLKLLRSLMTKGVEALAIECYAAAREMGLEREIRDNLRDLGERPFPDLLDAMVRTHVVHARRRRHEVEAALEQAEALGLRVPLARAVLDAYERTSRRLESTPFAQVPTVEDATAWLSESMR